MGVVDVSAVGGADCEVVSCSNPVLRGAQHDEGGGEEGDLMWVGPDAHRNVLGGHAKQRQSPQVGDE